MSRKLITLSVLTGGLALLISSCSAAPSAETEASKVEYMQTTKPGAAVEFNYNVEDQGTDTGPRDIKLQITEGYNSGILTVNVIQNSELSVAGGSGVYTFDMSGSQPHEILLSVTPLSTGKHYLNFNAVADRGRGQIAPANYAIPIYAGVEPEKKRINTVSDTPRTTANPGVKVMDAEEEIITQTPE